VRESEGEKETEMEKKKNFTRCVFQMTFNAQNNEKSLNSSEFEINNNNNNKAAKKNSCQMYFFAMGFFSK
jgi:hypothetical protein